MIIFIRGNVPSLKNSKQIIKVGGKPRLIPSKLHEKYMKQNARYWMAEKLKFWGAVKFEETPYRVQFTFVRGSKHKFDYDNVLATCFDAMVKFKWLLDDNADIILPSFSEYMYDKNNPGVYIEVLNGEN